MTSAGTKAPNRRPPGAARRDAPSVEVEDRSDHWVPGVKWKATGVMPDPPQTTPDVEMNVLLIAYELVEPAAGEDRLEAHQRFLRVLETYPVRAKLTSSAWLVKTPRSAIDVLEALDRHLMPADRLFVGAMSGEAAWRNVEQGFDWLEETLGSCGRPERGMARKAT